MARIDTDFLIVGGGIAGLSSAYALAGRGARATVLERRVVGAAASGVNFGGLRINGRDPPEIPLSLRAMEFWRELRRHVGHDCDVEFTGYLEGAQAPKQMEVLERWAQMAREHGLAPVMLTDKQIREQFPYLHPSFIGGVLMPEDGSANPRLVCPYLALATRRLGADIRENTGVTEIRHDGQRWRALASTGDEFAAPVLVNAAGAWAGKLAASVGDEVPWTTIAPQMVVSEPIAHFIKGTIDVEILGRHFYARQIPRGNLIFGRGPGTVDLEAERAFFMPQNAFNSSKILLGLIPRLAPHHIIRHWSGVEGKMPDSLPVLDFSASRPGLIHAFGFSGHGFELGPGVGGVVADLALTGRTATDISGFAIGRFAAKTAVSA